MIGNRYEAETNGAFQEWYTLDAKPGELNYIIKALKHYIGKDGLSFETRMDVGNLACKMKEILDSEPKQL